MRFGRYKETNWQLAEKYSRPRLRSFCRGDSTKTSAAYEAQLMLKAHYRGPWKMIAAITKREIRSWSNHYFSDAWEWIRTRIFRRPKGEAYAALEREIAEEEALEILGDELWGGYQVKKNRVN